MIKYRIKEITYGDGSKKFKVEYQKSSLSSIEQFCSYGQLFVLIFLTILTSGALLIVIALALLYLYIFPEWEYLTEFDALYEAQLYIEQKQERDKEAFEQEQKEKELKKAQKIVSERVVKLRDRAFELKD